MSVRRQLNRGTYLFNCATQGLKPIWTTEASSLTNQKRLPQSLSRLQWESPNQHCAFVWVVTFVLIGRWFTSTIKDHCCMLQSNKKRSSSSPGWADEHTNTLREEAGRVTLQRTGDAAILDVSPLQAVPHTGRWRPTLQRWTPTSFPHVNLCLTPLNSVFFYSC